MAFAMLLLLSIMINFATAAASTDIGFSMPMIHRHSPLSPLRKSNITKLDLLYSDRARMRCSSSVRYQKSKASTETPICYEPGMYLTYFYIGSSLTKTFVHIDTGSDLTWIQCYPCSLCGAVSCPPYDPLTSSTYKRFPCDAFYCVGENDLHCTSDGKCMFVITYRDQSLVFGAMATETFSVKDDFGKFRNLSNNMIFGCAHFDREPGNFSGNGLLGLNVGPLSFLRQLSITKFSYCLPPPDFHDYHPIRFGSFAKLLGQRAPYLESTLQNPWPYTLQVYAIAVGGPQEDHAYVHMLSGIFDMKIDTGSTFTHIRADIFHSLLQDLERVIAWEKREIYGVPNCYKGDIEDGRGINVTFYIRPGIEVTMRKEGLFYRYGEYICLGIMPVTSYSSTMGMNAQINYNIGYDLAKKQVWFQPMDCTEF